LDRTEHQSPDDRQQARELSLEPSRPPAKVPGYNVLQFLGSGAYGEVWSATDLTTNRRVAIKFYTRRNRNDIGMLAREVEKLVVLEADRYVVQLLNVGWDADPPYYVMEYIEHGSLEDRLKRGFPMQVDEAVSLFKEIATGMMHLHRKGIFHCDLKPGNVLLDQDGHPRVADFGQARLSTDDTPALGTLFFMAPEQADMKAVPEASWDVYSLGCLLFSMLTGKPPYYSEDLAGQIETTDVIGERLLKYRDNLMAAELPTAHRKIAGVDRSLADIIDRCIAADPKRRFNSIESVLSALEAREFTKTGRPLLLLGFVAPVLLLVVFGLFGYWAFNQALARTNDAVTAKARDSNNYTALMAAKKAASDINQYFRAVSQLAHDESFVDKFEKAMAVEGLKALRLELANPVDNNQLDDVRERYRNHPAIAPLLDVLEDRLKDRFNEYPKAASWFVCDRLGNQVASAFPDENRTLGKNYAYRSYFTGFNSDLPPSHVPELSVADGGDAIKQSDISLGEPRKITARAHLSGVFLSKQSKTWKVAFSTPIVSDANEIIGIVAVTVELGELVDFVKDQANRDRYAILVDGRPPDVGGAKNYDGAILEHPIYGDLNTRLKGIPKELENTRVDLDVATEKNVAEVFEAFFDPVGETAVSKNLPNRSAYTKESIVSVEPVMVQLQRTPLDLLKVDMPENQEEPTRLFVLVLQDYENVQTDVRALEAQLTWLGGLATLTLLTVLALMGYFVNRLLKESKSRLTRAFGGRANETFSSFPTLEQTKEWK
jgi:serine/threonine protein kinase